MYAISISDDGRILSATYVQYAPDGAIVVDMLPEGNIADYLYIDGSYVYDPLPMPDLPEQEVSADDVLNVLLGVTA